MKLNKKILLPVILIAAVLLLSSCAPGNERFTVQEPAGFFMGIWHGAIMGVSFIISLFNDSVHIYEIYNSGWAYDLGFILGASIIFGGTCRAGSRKKC